MKIKNISQPILDLNISALFALISMYLLRFIIPDGYKTRFLDRGYILLGLFFMGLSIIFIFSLINNRDFKFKLKFDFPDLKDFILLGLPMSPIISFALLNVEYLNFIGFIYVIGIPFIFCLIFSFILPSLFSYFGSFKILMISGLALSFTILNMAQITNNPTNQVFNSQFITQGLYLIGSFTITYLLYIFNKTIAYTVVIVFMLTGIVSNFLNNFSPKDSKVTQTVNRLKSFTDNNKNKIINKKDVYVLVFESYANLETLKYYGYDNNKQIDFLKDNNFTIYHGAYSNGAKSLSSTSRILELKNKLPKDERYYLNGNAFVLDVFKANGYETIGLFKSPYSFGSSPISWDKYFPKDDVSKIGGKTILKAIYEGYFRFDIFDDDYDNSTYLKLRNQFLSSNDEKPTLFYTHGEYPGHSQNSGKCIDNERQKYFDGIEKANLEMKNNIEILKKNSNSIIVIVGDHGPYLTKNCTVLENYEQTEIDKYDIQDRYGAFLAIHWPKELTENNKLFDELKLKRKFLDKFYENTAGINVHNGIIQGGKDDKKPLFENRTYQLEK